MQFKQYSLYLQELETVPARNDKMVILAKMINELKDPNEVKAALYLIRGNVLPVYQSLEFGFSQKLVLKSWQEIFPDHSIQEMYEQVGDVGLLAEELVLEDIDSDITLVQMHKDLIELALFSGKDSQKKKIKAFQDLSKNVSAIELKYLSRIIVGKIRLGLSDKSVIDSLSFAKIGDKSLSKEIEKAFGVESDIGEIANKLLSENGESEIRATKIKIGVPVASKLVEREKDEKAIMDRMKKTLIQPKYDGLRLQIHFNRKGIKNELDKIVSKSTDEIGLFSDSDTSKQYVKIYSRNLSDMTDMFPDVVEEIQKLSVDSIVLDTEAIGFDPNTSELVPFQETIQRKRKFDVNEKMQSIPVRVFAFDIFHLNGEDLINKKLSDRMKLLKESIGDYQGEIKFSETIEVNDSKELKKKFIEYKEQGLEGLIAKKTDSLYSPGTRNYDWIKLKVKAKSELADTLDAVVLGYYYGKGVRSKFGIGAILLGSYDSKKDKYFSLAKLGTGVKDEQWLEIKKRLDEVKTEEFPKNVEINKQVMPDILCFPEVVVVVIADEITKSKVHGPEDNAFSLRFPRLKQFDRDKLPEQSTSFQEIARMYQLG